MIFMSNIFTKHITALVCLAVMVVLSACGSSNSDDSPEAIKIGLNLELTGTLPDVGEQGRNAAEMFVESINENGGIEIDGKIYEIETVIKDNGATEEGVIAATEALVKEGQVLAIVGANTSFLAIPASGAANDLETVLISPWSTDERATLNRPYAFRASYLTSFQGMILAGFAHSEYAGTNACMFYADDSPFPKGIVTSFTGEWESLGGTVAANETFLTGDEDFSTQLTNLKDAGCGFIFLPQYANEVPAIVKQAHTLGVTSPFLGAGSWASQDLLDACGADCDGYFFNQQFVPQGATGAAKEFVDTYQAKYDEIPGDVAALTRDALLLVVEALKNCGSVTGTLSADRACVREGMSIIQGFEGITGTFSFDENGDPEKCVFIVQIGDGTVAYYDTVCPAG